MPVLQESEWDLLTKNICAIAFVQGLPVGFKTYNNYAIVTSNNNEMYVNENNIFYVKKYIQNIFDPKKKIQENKNILLKDSYIFDISFNNDICRT